MTPYEIKLLLDIYTSPNWFEGRDEQIFKETIKGFENSGLIAIVGYSGTARLTRKGRAHVIQLCNLLYPAEATYWVDQFGNKIPDTI